MNILTETVLIKRWILILKSMIASLAPTMSVFEQGTVNEEQGSSLSFMGIQKKINPLYSSVKSVAN